MSYMACSLQYMASLTVSDPHQNQQQTPHMCGPALTSLPVVPLGLGQSLPCVDLKHALSPFLCVGC